MNAATGRIRGAQREQFWKCSYEEEVVRERIRRKGRAKRGNEGKKTREKGRQVCKSSNATWKEAGVKEE